jgi:hypothetical protein
VAERREAGAGGVVAVRFAELAASGAGDSGAGDSGAAGRWLVRLRVTAADPDRLLTCQATRPHRPPSYRLLELARQ